MRNGRKTSGGRLLCADQSGTETSPTSKNGKHCGGIMEGTKELITTDAIRSKVYILRGQQVMLDQDLAEIYGYQVKNLNAVPR